MLLTEGQFEKLQGKRFGIKWPYAPGIEPVSVAALLAQLGMLDVERDALMFVELLIVQGLEYADFIRYMMFVAASAMKHTVGARYSLAELKGFRDCHLVVLLDDLFAIGKRVDGLSEYLRGPVDEGPLRDDIERYYAMTGDGMRYACEAIALSFQFSEYRAMIGRLPATRAFMLECAETLEQMLDNSEKFNTLTFSDKRP